MRGHRVLSMVAKREGRPEFAVWGLWQHEISDKRDAIRPVSWMLERCPEFRLRSLLGADLETAILEIVSVTPATISDLAKRTGATRAAVHEAVESLTARGLARKPHQGYRRLVSVPPPLAEWLRQFPVKREAA
jgi:biotin operon repressor